MQLYPVGGTTFASDGSSKYPDVKVTLRNITRNAKASIYSNPVDGSYAFELSNPEFGGYADGDSCEVIGRIGPFVKRNTFTIDTSAPPPTENLTLAVEDNLQILDFLRLNEELITFFRSKLTDPNNRGTSVTNTQTGTGSKVKFELPEATAKFVKAVLVDDVIKTEWSDYYVEFQDKSALTKPIVYFLSPPSDGAQVDIIYTYGNSWIYPDKPMVGISLEYYPRCQVNVFPITTAEAGLGALANKSTIGGSITVWSNKSNEVIDIVSEARKLVLENKKNFHHFKFITIKRTSGLIVTSRRGNRITQQVQDFEVLHRFEEINN